MTLEWRDEESYSNQLHTPNLSWGSSVAFPTKVTALRVAMIKLVSKQASDRHCGIVPVDSPKSCPDDGRLLLAVKMRGNLVRYQRVIGLLLVVRKDHEVVDKHAS